MNKEDITMFKDFLHQMEDFFIKSFREKYDNLLFEYYQDKFADLDDFKESDTYTLAKYKYSFEDYQKINYLKHKNDTHLKMSLDNEAIIIEMWYDDEKDKYMYSYEDDIEKTYITREYDKISQYIANFLNEVSDKYIAFT